MSRRYGGRFAVRVIGLDHFRNIKMKLFDIARGSSSGLEGSYRGQPLGSASQEVRFEWIKQEASKLGSEAHAVWGAVGSAANPLVQRNAEIAREALRAKQERDAAKARLRSDGKLPSTCKLK